MTKRPKTGEKRRTNQPLKIDRLPLEMRDRIRDEHNTKGRSWEEIQELSPAWPEWEKVPAEVKRLFPGQRLPHSNLHRWNDLRIEQVNKAVNERSEIARRFAETLGRGELKTAEPAVLNAIYNLTFSLMNAGGDEQKLLKELQEFGWILAEFKKSEVRQAMVDLESKRVKLLEEDADRKKKLFDRQSNEVAKKLGKGKGLTIADINSIRERTFGLPPIQAAAGN